MQVIVDFLKGIANFCSTLLDYVVSTVRGTGDVLTMLKDFTANIALYFSWLPGEYVAIILIVFGVAVTYKILGREG